VQLAQKKSTLDKIIEKLEAEGEEIKRSIARLRSAQIDASKRTRAPRKPAAPPAEGAKP
jgi:hypothetical protein